MRFHSCPVVLGLCLLAPASAAAQTVYFSVGKEIRTLVAPATGLGTLVHTSPMFVGDLALCAGNPAETSAAGVQYLYFVERDAVGGDRISRLNVKAPLTKKVLVNATAQTIFTVLPEHGRVGEIRLTPECHVVFAADTGVFQVNGWGSFSDPETTTPFIETGDGSGLAVAFDGSLRYSNGGAVKVSPSGATLKSIGTAIVGVGVANAGAGSTVPGWSTAEPLSVGRVCVSTVNVVTCGSKSATDLGTTLATFAVSGSSAVNKAQFFEFFTNDTAIVATSVDPDAGVGGAGAKFNGILWQVAGGVLSEVTRGPKVNGEFVPIVGVAVGPSESAAAAVTTVPGDLQTVNFGPVTFRVDTPMACNLAIKLRQLSWTDAHDKLNSVPSPPPGSPAPPNYLLDRGFGGESWVDDVDVNITGGNCGLSATTPAFVFIAQFIDIAPSRAVLHCTGNVCEPATHGNFPYSQPDDEGDSALPDNFSDFLTARIESTQAKLEFGSPLSRDAVVDGAIDSEIGNATSHNATGGLSLRFRICANGETPPCTTFAPAEQPDPPASGAGLSVTRIDGFGAAIADCRVNDQGSSTPDLPVFRVSDADGVTHNFNLNTPLETLNRPPAGEPDCELNDLTNGQSGLFVATVFSHSGKFTKTSILFRLIK